MLTDEQRRQIEMDAAAQIRSEHIERREQWGKLNSHRMRGLFDDLRETIVEEAWYGKSVTEKLNDVSRMVYESDRYNAIEAGVDKAKDLMQEFYGYDDPEQSVEDPEIDHER